MQHHKECENCICVKCEVKHKQSTNCPLIGFNRTSAEVFIIETQVDEVNETISEDRRIETLTAGKDLSFIDFTRLLLGDTVIEESKKGFFRTEKKMQMVKKEVV